jgi:hypothetical protein
VNADGPNRGIVTRRQPDYGLHQLGVVAKTFPLDKIHRALAATERESARQRDLPGHVTVYYVIPLALYMQSSLSGSFALSAGGNSVAGATVGEHQRGR